MIERFFLEKQVRICMKAKFKKGRPAKLTADQIKQLVSEYDPKNKYELCHRFNISPTTLSLYIKGSNFKIINESGESTFENHLYSHKEVRNLILQKFELQKKVAELSDKLKARQQIEKLNEARSLEDICQILKEMIERLNKK
jgi:transposase